VRFRVLTELVKGLRRAGGPDKKLPVKEESRVT